MIEFHITDPTEIERLTAEYAQAGRLELLWFVAECDWRREPGRLIVRIEPRKDTEPLRPGDDWMTRLARQLVGDERNKRRLDDAQHNG